MAPRIPVQQLSRQSSCQCALWASTRSSNAQPSQNPCRQASTGTAAKSTRLRRNMYAWLNGPGAVFRNPLPNSTNYLSAYDNRGNLLRRKRRDRGRVDVKTRREQDPDGEEEMQDSDESAPNDLEVTPKERLSDLRPYPLNRDFRSQAVLSEELRNHLYHEVVEQGLDISTVSALNNVDTRRVAAVVRLKTIEKQWIQEGKPLAKPYNDAVLAMLPQTPWQKNATGLRHEGINDLPVHPWTRRQIFHPTSESREFTREDAAKVFHEKLLPPDERIAHPELVQMQKWANEGVSQDDRIDRRAEIDNKAMEDEAKLAERKKEWEQRTQVVVPGRRWDFKFQDIGANDPGKDGRRRAAVGARYGFPHEDRKRGMTKIPTRVL